MRRPLIAARAIQEHNTIIRAFVEESSEILRYRNEMQLK